MTTTIERLRAILIKDYEVDPRLLTPDAALEGLGIDSLGVVELLWTIEDEFKIKLPQEPEDLPTLADVTRYIDTLMAEQRAGTARVSVSGAIS
jgi:acyl carrier protein